MKILIFIYFPILKSFIPLSLKQINFCGTNYGLLSTTTEVLCFFKAMQYCNKVFQNVRPALQNHIAENI